MNRIPTGKGTEKMKFSTIWQYPNYIMNTGYGQITYEDWLKKEMKRIKKGYRIVTEEETGRICLAK